MNPENITAPSQSASASIEQGVKSMVHDVKTKAYDTRASYEDKIRQSPEKAVLIALAAGYCLHVLPKRSLIAAPIHLVAFLAKPALLALGAAKLCEIVQQQARK